MGRPADSWKLGCLNMPSIAHKQSALPETNTILLLKPLCLSCFVMTAALAQLTVMN